MKLQFVFFFHILLFTGCAARTTFYDRRTGKRVAEFRGDMNGSRYSDAGTVWSVDAVSHSQPTLAMGHAVSGIVKAGGSAAAGTILAVESGGASTGVGAAATKLAAPATVISADATGNTPPATPTPVRAH